MEFYIEKIFLRAAFALQMLASLNALTKIFFMLATSVLHVITEDSVVEKKITKKR